MKTTRYALAGWLAVAEAVLLIPLILIVVALDFLAADFAMAGLMIGVLNIAGLAVGVFILYRFRHLLHERFAFCGTDTHIEVLIWTNVLFATLGVLGLIPALELTATIAVAICFVPFGVVTAAFGVRLLSISEDLFGLQKPFAYLTIVAGICAASILLAPVGLLCAIAAIFVQGMIFLRAQEQVEFV